MTVENPEGQAAAGSEEITRPDALPENYWDATTKAPKYEDLGKDLADLPALRELKTKHDERQARIPQDGKYDLGLPKDFQIPQGMKWDVPPETVKAVTDIAKERGWTQDDVTALAAFEATRQLNGDKELQTFLANQTKELGQGAETRRSELKTWLGSKDASGLTKDQAAALLPMLDYRHGVEALETMKKMIAGARLAGNPGNNAANDDFAEHAASLDKPNSARKLLEVANAAAKH